ncbi:MAG TPA: flagellar motor protein MotB [Gaiellales bacterium]|nr:flagellar motor protein MotB [Gaiellales bacterium]
MSGHARRGRRGGGHGGGHEGGDERWLLTYADMITLLMALFMVLFSISSVNISKYQVLQRALQKAFMGGVLDGGKSFQQGEPTRIQGVQSATASQQMDSSFQIMSHSLIGKVAPASQAQRAAARKQAAEEEANLESIQRQVASYAHLHGFSGLIKTSIDQRGLVIRLLTDKVLFDSGHATLKPTATPILTEVSHLLMSTKFSNGIRVEGNTDNVPISGGEFPSNWELSTARANAVLEFFIHHGVSERRLTVAGFADQNPIAPNDSADGRALNRRVDVVVLRNATQSQGATSP